MRRHSRSVLPVGVAERSSGYRSRSRDTAESVTNSVALQRLPGVGRGLRGRPHREDHVRFTMRSGGTGMATHAAISSELRQAVSGGRHLTTLQMKTASAAADSREILVAAHRRARRRRPVSSSPVGPSPHDQPGVRRPSPERRGGPRTAGHLVQPATVARSLEEIVGASDRLRTDRAGGIVRDSRGGDRSLPSGSRLGAPGCRPVSGWCLGSNQPGRTHRGRGRAFGKTTGFPSCRCFPGIARLCRPFIVSDCSTASRFCLATSRFERRVSSDRLAALLMIRERDCGTFKSARASCASLRMSIKCFSALSWLWPGVLRIQGEASTTHFFDAQREGCRASVELDRDRARSRAARRQLACGR